MGRLLQIEDLKTYFFMPEGVCKAVDGISYSIQPNETVGIVGESGCGKSVSALSILGLIQAPGRIVGGKIHFEDLDLTAIPLEKMRKIRGNDISMIFQEPMTSLNPVFTIGFQLSEAIMRHQGLSKEEARHRSVEMLRLVRIPDPEKRIHDYPHNLSGGMRQRVMIAMALSCEPKLLIADEPTTALDVTIQAQILDLMLKLKSDRRMSIILITHDLGIVAEIAQRVIVMYAGKIVEIADVDEIFNNPFHPYTQGLYESLPRIDRRKKRGEKTEPLREIPGVVPSPFDVPKGCHFWPRCPRTVSLCKDGEPQLEEVETNHFVSCWLMKGEA
jgi:peptide/nickel transport system ATP-binding protein/oligopeptide transport system ATP-binding protein